MSGQLAAIAGLLVSGEPVARDRIVAAMWPTGTLPASWEQALKTRISQLRSLLRPGWRIIILDRYADTLTKWQLVAPDRIAA